MAQDYVVQFNETSNLYLTAIIVDPGNETLPTYQWGNSESAIGYETLQEAKDVATGIGGGTVGTTRP